MTNFGFCFCPVLSRSDCSGTLCVWVVDYSGATRFAPTPYDIRRDEWDPIEGSLVFENSDAGRRRTLLAYAKSMVEDMRRIETIVRELEPRGRYKAEEVIRRWYNFSPGKERVLPADPVPPPVPVSAEA